jgi:hypothetical protein
MAIRERRRILSLCCKGGIALTIDRIDEPFEKHAEGIDNTRMAKKIYLKLILLNNFLENIEAI